MRYIGGKSKLAKRITADILRTTSVRNVYIEPFVGGGSALGELAPHFSTVYVSDIHPDLIMMWREFQQGWEPENYISEDDYNLLKWESASPWRGLVGFGQSFGAKWFGGYARGKTAKGEDRNFLDEAIRNAKNIASKLPVSTVFTTCSYKDWFPEPEDVVYADPPYSGTQGYETGTFDTDEFWKVMRKWRDAGVEVFVSEYKAPDDWECIAQYDHGNSLGFTRFDTTERLWH